jgi:hypothetical protein
MCAYGAPHPIPAGARRDARFCSQRCRQAAARERGAAVELDQAQHPCRLAYADPPYPGMADLYRGHPAYGGEVDLAELLGRLHRDYDGWALSTSAWALPSVLALAYGLGVRPAVAAWVRGARPAASKRPLNAWEPVIYVRARSVLVEAPAADVLVHHHQPRRVDRGQVIGSKPAVFCSWILELIGAAANDAFDDLYPGSGIAGRVWDLSRGAA